MTATNPATAEETPILEGRRLQATAVELNDAEQLVVVELHDEGQGQRALIPFGDFRIAQSDPLRVAVGDQFEVHVEQRTNDGQRWVASRDKAARLQAFEAVQAAYKKGELIDGEIVGTMDGGFSVDIGVRAFLPASQVGLRPIRRADDVLGQQLSFKIIRFDKSRHNVVLSRRVLLEAERAGRMERLRVGAVVEGRVKNFTEYGAFIDLGDGLEGLLHVEEMAWTKVRRPEEVLRPDQALTVKVIKMDRANNKIGLSLRQLQDDPWLHATERFPNGTEVRGLVVSKTDFGVFIEIEPGLEGLVLSSGALVRPEDTVILRKVDIGDELDAKVVDLDLEGRRLTLLLQREA